MAGFTHCTDLSPKCVLRVLLDDLIEARVQPPAICVPSDDENATAPTAQVPGDAPKDDHNPVFGDLFPNAIWLLEVGGGAHRDATDLI